MYSVNFPAARLLAITAVVVLLNACSDDNGTLPQASQNSLPDNTTAEYVGAQQCASCHQEQLAMWQGSHHDLAMQTVSEATVLGDFNDASFDYFGTVSKFYKKNGQYFVRTDGPDGALTEYPIAYTFGVYPLQQYLVKFPKGHYQALNIVWDTRSQEEGGQRWFHLYPDEHIKHDDELHWTGINQNWNYVCADCHSTNLQKAYDFADKEYKTTWSEIDVSCEACHGPASKHLSWAETGLPADTGKGFAVSYAERRDVLWPIDPQSGNARRSTAKVSNIEIEACAPCHARRSRISPETRPGEALLDDFRLSLLVEPLYHADGQINGEVYVYGSFLQSKMYHAGVTCSDCHQPHSLQLRAQGNQLCAQCHATERYEQQSHHLHTPGSAGAQCVNCHMPAKNFMVVDARRDHSFRIPRPDLSVALGVPNACIQCHTTETDQWASAKLEENFGKRTDGHYGYALHAGRQGLPGAENLLSSLVVDDTQPAIVRATAVSLLPPYLSGRSAPALQLAANHEQPLLGFGLATALSQISSQRRLPFAYPLLYDGMQSTRLLAAAALLGNSLENLPADARSKFNAAIKQYEAAQLFNADRPEALVNLAGFYASQGQSVKAEAFYQSAIARAPYFTPAYANLADFYRVIGNDSAGEAVLRNALTKVSDKTAIQHALGLLLVRQKRSSEALDWLALAAKSSTASVHYVYVYAIALNSTGEPGQAIEVLEMANRRYPGNTDILYALISILREQGNPKRALHYENKLRALNP